MTIVSLVQSKNRCLEKILTFSETFLSQSIDDDLIALESFQTQRDSIFKAMELYDRKITEMASTLTAEEKTPELLALVRAEMNRKDELTRQLLSIDDQVIQKITAVQHKLVAEISKSKKNKELLGKFKSSWLTESGEEMDTTL